MRKLLNDDQAFQTCMKEYKGVKETNVKRKAKDIIASSDVMMMTGGRKVTALEEDR